MCVFQAELEEREERRKMQELRDQEKQKEDEKERLQEQKRVIVVDRYHRPKVFCLAYKCWKQDFYFDSTWAQMHRSFCAQQFF